MDVISPREEIENFDIKFRVKRIIHRDIGKRTAIVNGILLEKPSKMRKLTREMTIVGVFPSIFKDDEFEAEAQYEMDNNYGPKLKLTKIPEYVIPENEKALAKFIAIRIKGLGLKKATEMVSDLGLNIIDLICADKVDFSKYKISEKKGEAIKKGLSNIVSFERLAISIQELGFPLYYATKIYKEFGETSLQVLKENPYKISDIELLPFSVVDMIAKKNGLVYDCEERIQASIKAFINYRILNYGDICIYQSMLIANLNSFLLKEGCYSEKITRKRIKECLSKLISKKDIICEQDDLLNKYLYKPHYNKVEKTIVNRIISFVNDWRPPFCKEFQIDLFIDDWERKYGELDGLQIQAIKNSLLNNISILTGNPGTGKTFTTNLIVKCIQSIKKNAKISLLAPTGKASERITELTGLKASTIHRGLQLKQFFGDTKIEPIDADFIIIDESSMIDAELFAILMKSIGDDSRIIFVGDFEQLPPVGAGLVLKDLIETKKIPIIRLTTIFRQARNSDIIMNSQAIINGLDTKNKKGFQIDTTEDSDFHFIEENNTLKIQDKIEKLLDDLLAKGYKLRDISLLTCMKKGDLGTLELNERLQFKLNPNASKEDSVCYDLYGMIKFYIGDRVIQTQNNYDLQVFNGYVGEIINIFEDINEKGQEQTRIEVEYAQQGKTVIYSENQIGELDLCYVMTIHKSQGSEFPVIIIPVHFSQKQMLNRNLLYTGLTRGKKEVFMIGQPEALDYGIKHVETFQRLSRIKENVLKGLKEISEKEEKEISI